MDSHWAPASWLIGPPAPRGLLYVRLGLQLTVLGLVLTWVFAHLGGLALGPTTVSETANDTGRLFNWHPLLMTLAFPLLMGEALSSYKRPAIGARLKDRSHKKLVHFALQSAASACVVAGFVAVLKSHTLKKPEPMANFYSPHSYLGLAVFALLGLQYGLGFWAYLAPKLSLSNRQALGPVHAFLGQATFILGLATMMVGIQEKATFLQAYAKVGVFTAPFRLAGVLQLALAFTGMAVMYAFAPSPTQRQAAAAAQQVAAASSGSSVQRMDSEGMPLYARGSLSDMS